MNPIVSAIQVGRPRLAEWHGRKFETSIFKNAASGMVQVRRHNLAGDEQADLRVHGGPNKAVYVYPSEHYPYWRERLERAELPWGSFGENLTTSGLDERTTHIGDLFQIGSAVLQVTQPRQPCYKLGYRLGRTDAVRTFWDSGKFGFYLAVVQEGEMQAGDEIQVEPTAAETEGVTVAEVIGLLKGEIWDEEVRERALRAEALPEGWKKELRKQ